MGIQSRFVYLRHFGLRTKINFCINTVFVCFFAWGKTLHTKNQNIHFSNSSSSFAESSKFIKFFFLVCLFFHSCNFPEFLFFLFRQQRHLAVVESSSWCLSNIVMALNLFKSLMDWDRVRHIVYLRSSFLVKSQQSTHHLVVHTPISRIFFSSFRQRHLAAPNRALIIFCFSQNRAP